MKIPVPLLHKVIHRLAVDAAEKGRAVFFADDGSYRLIKKPKTEESTFSIQPPARSGGGDAVEYGRCTLRLWGSVVDCWVEK